MNHVGTESGVTKNEAKVTGMETGACSQDLEMMAFERGLGLVAQRFISVTWEFIRNAASQILTPNPQNQNLNV